MSAFSNNNAHRSDGDIDNALVVVPGSAFNSNEAAHLFGEHMMSLQETFDITSKIDNTDKPLYGIRRGCYLKPKYGVKRVTACDEQRANWSEEQMAKSPVEETFDAVAGLGQDKERNGTTFGTNASAVTVGIVGLLRGPRRDVRTPQKLRKLTCDLVEKGKLLPGARTPFDTEAIIQLRDDIMRAPVTLEIQTPARQALRARIVDDIYCTGAARKDCRMDIVMGLPGAGKTSVVAKPLAARNGALIADSDIIKDAIKRAVPGMDQGPVGSQMAHLESAKLNHEILKRAMQAADNIVYTTVGHSEELLRRIIQEAADNGY